MNQSHACARHDLESHFEGKRPEVRALFDALVSMLEVRMSFAAVSVRRGYLVGHFVLGRRVKHPRFLRVETYSPRNHLHAFRIDALSDLDHEFADWAREAYAVGEQRHLDDS